MARARDRRPSPPARRLPASAADPQWRFEADGFTPLGSFARGGLANGWGANALAYEGDARRGWPVSGLKSGTVKCRMTRDD